MLMRCCRTSRTEQYHRGNIKTHRSEIQIFTGDYQLFDISPGLTKLCNVVVEVKTPNALHRSVILRTRFSPGNSPGWIQPGFSDRVYLNLFEFAYQAGVAVNIDSPKIVTPSVLINQSQYLLSNNDFPEIITMKFKRCSEIQIRIENT